MLNGSSPGRTGWRSKNSTYTYSCSASTNMCNTYDGNMQEQKVSIFLKKQGLNGNWLMQVSSKENQNKYPECESFRNSTSAAWQGAKLFTALTKITLYFHCSSFNIFLPRWRYKGFPPPVRFNPGKNIWKWWHSPCVYQNVNRKKLRALLQKDKGLQEEKLLWKWKEINGMQTQFATVHGWNCHSIQH